MGLLQMTKETLTFLGRPWWQGVAALVAIVALAITVYGVVSASPQSNRGEGGTNIGKCNIAGDVKGNNNVFQCNSEETPASLLPTRGDAQNNGFSPTPPGESDRSLEVDLMGPMYGAHWNTSEIDPAPFNPPEKEEQYKGFAMRTYAHFEDGSDATGGIFFSPPWKINGWTRGEFLLPRPIVANDNFVAIVGQHSHQGLGKNAYMVECVDERGHSLVAFRRVHEGGKRKLAYVNESLDRCMGATKLRLTVTTLKLQEGGLILKDAKIELQNSAR
ncbi:hypothetical protein [Nonomuraea sp. NPDC049480]|uniref:hypothetical protein n=1 Tax=Nonomuraea sp. NPDC049480 TaxID=3364353 RepID=UPI003794160D